MTQCVLTHNLSARYGAFFNCDERKLKAYICYIFVLPSIITTACFKKMKKYWCCPEPGDNSVCLDSYLDCEVFRGSRGHCYPGKSPALNLQRKWNKASASFLVSVTFELFFKSWNTRSSSPRVWRQHSALCPRASTSLHLSCCLQWAAHPGR